jgi:hypothetical protein
VRVTNINGSDADKSKITETLDSMDIDSNDVIWYYYTGRGMNYDTLPVSDEGEVPLTWVHQKLMDTDARLTIASYDCINNQAQIVNPPSGYSAKSFMLKFLFLESKGDIIISSSSSEKFSYGKNGVGGIFTNSLIDALMDNSSWSDVLESATRRTKQVAQEYGKVQEPKYEMKNMEKPESTNIIAIPGRFKVRGEYASFTELSTTIQKAISAAKGTEITITVSDLMRWNLGLTEENWKSYKRIEIDWDEVLNN